MKRFIASIIFFLLAGFVFSQTTNTDTTKSQTTTQSSTKLVKKRMNTVTIKKVDGKNQTTKKNKSQPTGKKEEDGTLPK